MKNIRILYLKIFLILVVKFSTYLNRHVFVMSDGSYCKFSRALSHLAMHGLYNSALFPFLRFPYLL